MGDFRSTRDVIVRTEVMGDAASFYEYVLGLPVSHRQDGLVGFETGAFQLFVEQGAPAHAPVFEFCVADVAAAKAKLVAAGCTVIEEDARVSRCYVRDPYGLAFNLRRG
jgi:predicted enzyme related to lactoylglutathione lyase